MAFDTDLLEGAPISMEHYHGKTRKVVRCESGIFGERTRLQNNYESFDEFKHYSEIYSLAKRLGYRSHTKARRDNPIIEYSVNPSDFRKVGL